MKILKKIQRSSYINKKIYIWHGQQILQRDSHIDEILDRHIKNGEFNKLNKNTMESLNLGRQKKRMSSVLK